MSEERKLKEMWAQTSSGKIFKPNLPHKDDFELTDVAQGLATLTRYAGQMSDLEPCCHPLSVGQHTVYMSKLMGKHGYSTLYQYLALHHDDCEGLIIDLPKPIKNFCPGYEKIESNVWKEAIAQKAYWGYFLPERIEDMPKEIKFYDWLMIKVERRDWFDKDKLSPGWTVPDREIDDCPEMKRYTFWANVKEAWLKRHIHLFNRLLEEYDLNHIHELDQDEAKHIARARIAKDLEG